MFIEYIDNNTQWRTYIPKESVVSYNNNHTPTPL